MVRCLLILTVLAVLVPIAPPVVADPIVTDLDGRAVDPFSDPSKWQVFVFTSVDCPIANRYAPELQRIGAAFAGPRLQIRLVYADPGQSAEEIRGHLRDYGYDFDALRDTQHALVDLIGATITPEVAVFDTERRLVYRGRIDDLYVDFGKRRAAPTVRDLEETLSALIDGHELSPRTTTAVGCYIPTLE